MNPVIPSKYLQTNLNRYETGPQALLRAQNVRLDGGRIRSRIGQDFLPANDIPYQYLGGTKYRNFRPIKVFWYNNRPWTYQRNDTDSYDGLAYYDFDSNQWRQGTLTYNGSVDYTSAPPILFEANNRLMFLGVNGVLQSAKLDKDVVDSNLVSYQTSLFRAGAPRALVPSSWATVDTTATYAQNWMANSSRCAYRFVWKRTNENGVEMYGPVSARFPVINQSGASRAAVMTIPIPTEILGYPAADQARFSLEIYRTKDCPFNTAGVAPDPGDEMFMTVEVRPTATDIANRSITITDIISSQALGLPLYTNSSQQGYVSSRERPPLARAGCYWDNRAWFGNVDTLATNEMEILSIHDAGAAPGFATGIQANDVLIIGDWCLEAVTAAPTNNQFQITTTAGIGAQLQRITEAAKSLCGQYNNIAGRLFELHPEMSPDDFTGKIVAQEIYTNAAKVFYAGVYGGNDFKHYFGLRRKNGWPGSNDPSPIKPNPLVRQGVGKGYNVPSVTCPAGVNQDLQITVEGGVAPDFGVGDWVNVARPPSNNGGYSGGLYKCKSIAGPVITLEGYTGSFGPVTHTAGAGIYAGVSMILTIACVRVTAEKTESPAVQGQTRMPNALFYSPIQEPESAPWANVARIGNSDAEIIALKGVEDSLYIFKSDGLFRLYNQSGDYAVETVDKSLVLVGPDLIAQLGSSIFALTTKGVYEISGSSTRRVSYDIQNELDVLCSGNPSGARKTGFAVGNEEDHSVSFWLPSYNTSSGVASTRPNICYVYDGQGWTKRNDQANGACCGRRYDSPDQSHMYTVKDMEGWLTRERKAKNALDYCDEKITNSSAAATVLVQADLIIRVTIGNTSKYATIASNALFDWADLLVGAVIVINGDMSTRAYVTNVLSEAPTGVFQLQLEFADTTKTTTNWGALPGALDIYLGINKKWQFSHQDAEDTSSTKLWQDVCFPVQQPYFSSADVSFRSDINSTETVLQSNLRGFAYTTTPSSWPLLQEDATLGDKILSTIVPAAHARTSKIMVGVQHRRAMEHISFYGYFFRARGGGKEIERSSS